MRDNEHKTAGKLPEERQSAIQSILLYLHDLTYLLAVILIIFLLCFRVVVVSGSSMERTLIDGDYLLLLSNTMYRTPQQGDIVVASKDSFDNGEPIIKRVIATEGQWVDIDFETGTVYVDNQPLENEYYTSSPTTKPWIDAAEFPVLVEENCVFVMGDNRSNSHDSRSMDIGMVDCREILGRAIFLFLPGTDHNGSARDFSRIGVLS